MRSQLTQQLTIACLSSMMLLGCSTPGIQTSANPSRSPVSSIDTAKITAIQTQVAEDDQALAALQKDPKSYLKNQGITLSEDQQVKVLEAGSKIYFVLDDRSLQLLHPGLNKAADPENESAKKLAAIRAKAASDPGFKTELLKNTTQTLIKEGVTEEVASVMEAVDYQPNVNLFIFAREGSEITRGSSAPDWNLNAFMFKADQNGNEIKLPPVFHALTKTILDKNLGPDAPPYKQSLAVSKAINAERLHKMSINWFIGFASACNATLSLVSPKFCTTILASSLEKIENDAQNPLVVSFKNFLASPNARQETMNLLPDVEKRYHEALQSYNTLKPKLRAVTPQNRGLIISEVRQMLNQLESFYNQVSVLNQKYYYIFSYIYPNTKENTLIDNSFPVNVITLSDWYFAVENVRKQLKSQLETLEAAEKSKS